jgi:hypothetical protein
VPYHCRRVIRVVIICQEIVITYHFKFLLICPISNITTGAVKYNLFDSGGRQMAPQSAKYSRPP